MFCPNVKCSSPKTFIYKTVPDYSSLLVEEWRECRVCGARFKTINQYAYIVSVDKEDQLISLIRKAIGKSDEIKRSMQKLVSKTV